MSDEEFGVIPPEEEVAEEEEVEKTSPAERIIKCKYCGEEIKFKDWLRHIKEKHPEAYEEWRRRLGEGRKRAWERWREERAKAKVEVEERKIIEEEEMPPEQLVSLYGREGLDKLKFKRLMEMVKTAPGVKSSQVDWVESRWKTFRRMREDPQELFRVLRDEAGIKDKIASAIVQAVFSLEQEYADVLARRGEPVFVPRGVGETRVETYPRFPEYRPSYQPQYQPPSQPQWPTTPQHYPGYERPYYPQYPTPMYQPYHERPLTKEEVVKIMNEFFTERFEKRKFEEKVDHLYKAVEGLKDYVEELRHDFEKKLLAKKLEEEREKPKESPEVAALREQLGEANRTIEELRKQIEGLSRELEKKERERLESRLKTLDARLREMSAELTELRRTQQIGGYQQDTYRILSEIIREAGERKPVETVMRMLFPERTPPPRVSRPPSLLPPEVEAELKSAGILEESYGG